MAGAEQRVRNYWVHTPGNVLESRAVPVVDPNAGYDALNLPEAIGVAVANALCATQINVRHPIYAMPTAQSDVIFVCSQSDVIVSDASWVDVTGFYLDHHEQAVIRRIGMRLPFGAMYDDVQWRIAAGNYVIAGLNDIGCDFDGLSSGQMIEVLVKIDSVEQSSKISLQAKKLTPGSVVARGALYGWKDAPRDPGNNRAGWIGD